MIFISRDIHTSCKGHATQVVSTAAQLFSRTVGSCFQLAGMRAQAYFCFTVNNWFDVMNSSKVSNACLTKLSQCMLRNDYDRFFYQLSIFNFSRPGMDIIG